MNKKPFLLLLMAVVILFATGCFAAEKNSKLNIAKLSDTKQLTTEELEQYDLTVKKVELDVFAKKVTLFFFKEPLSKILPSLIKNFEFENGVSPETPITANIKNKTVEEALTSILKTRGLGYIIKSNDSISIIKQPIITYTAYNQPFSLVITSMLSGYSYSLRDGAEEELNTPVTAEFDEVPLEIALDRLLSPIKLFWEKKDGVYYIFKEKEALFDIFFPLMSQSFEITSSRSGNTVGGTGTVSSTPAVNDYSSGGMSSALSSAMAKGATSTVESLTKTIEPFLTKTGKFALHKETGTIWIRDRADIVDRIGEFINKLNSRLRVPVNIKGIITEVTLSRGHEYGIDWDKALGNTVVNGGFFNAIKGVAKVQAGSLPSFESVQNNTIAISSSFSAAALSSYIRALEEYGDVKIVSKPSLTVLNGAIGSLIVGKTISYVAQSYSSRTASEATTTSIIVKPLQTGLSFYVLPRIISDQEALLYISPEITALSEQRSIRAGDNATVEAPSLTLKQTQTVINIKNGTTILISGLMSEEDSKQDKKIPILGNIPIIGIPFQYKSSQKKTSELAIMVEVSW